MPKNNPTAAERVTPRMTAVIGTDIGTGVKLRTATATNHAANTPIRPPMPASIADSTRNWLRMSRLRAPTDLRMPISCVRSVTTASMMFIITTPPTTMKTETTPTAVAAMAPVN